MNEADDPVARLASFAAATVYEASGKSGDMSPDIRAIGAGVRLCAPAFTVRCWAGDARGLWEAVAAAPAGSAIVADMGDSERITALGGTTVLACRARGIAGLVTNAAVRDVAEVRSSNFPVFARGIALRGTAKTAPGLIGIPVVVGGAMVAPGDIVIGDDDGVVVVPATLAGQIAVAAAARAEAEAAIDQRIRAGESPLDILGLRLS